MASYLVEFHPAAVEEGRAAREWYEQRNTSAAAAFLAELDKAIAKISETPEGSPSYVHGTRRFLLRRFPFYVVFRVCRDRIVIVAIAHARRRPNYWKSR
ncbi:MAG: type II toxin-antitoxin system RelE/ParE family toxin [Candidatus Eisenbacteria sp.]|nr:type II toxin-antitoxin system RelE/ParE family toxin [Candidatus Eisenbacteria bacterium]